MRITFYASDKPREIMLAKSLADGARAFGDDLEIRRTSEYGEDEHGNDLKFPGPTPDTEVACVFGVKGKSRQILEDHRAVGRGTLYFDKGYTREKGECGHTLYSRVSVNAADPLAYMMNGKVGDDRWRRLGLTLNNRTLALHGHILIATSSQKYHDFHGLSSVEGYVQRLVGRVRRLTKRQIIYRPKPSYRGAKPIQGAAFSSASQTIADALRGCHCVVTHGATAAMDGILAGVPAIVLGNGIARPVAATAIEKIDDPFWADDELRFQWACAMAYAQWTADELRSGEAWGYLRDEIIRQLGAS